MANVVSNTYVWKGKNKQGKAVSRTMNAASPADVKSELRRQGIIPTSVRKKNVRKKGKVTPGDIAIFSRQLATMMESGVPLVQSFEIIGRGHENLRRRWHDRRLLHLSGLRDSHLGRADALACRPVSCHKTCACTSSRHDHGCVVSVQRTIKLSCGCYCPCYRCRNTGRATH